MSHDKIKAAARERMAGTGEPYAAARREVIRQYQASAGRVPLPGTGMLVWINGPCGVGKTATAFELRRRLPGSVVCDPAHVGYGMRRMLPASLRRMWQDIPAWRRAVRELLRMTLAGHDGPVIAPMMLVDPGHFQEIICGLRGWRHRAASLRLAGRARDRGTAAAWPQPRPGAENPALGSRSPRWVAAAASPARVRPARPHRPQERGAGRRHHLRLGGTGDHAGCRRPGAGLAAPVRDNRAPHPDALGVAPPAGSAGKTQKTTTTAPTGRWSW